MEMSEPELRAALVMNGRTDAETNQVIGDARNKAEVISTAGDRLRPGSRKQGSAAVASNLSDCFLWDQL